MADRSVAVERAGEWRTAGGTSVESMLSAFDAYADQLAPALAGHWS